MQNGIKNQKLKEKSHTCICECGHPDYSHSGRDEEHLGKCLGLTTEHHKGLDYGLCHCKKYTCAIDTSLPQIHLRSLSGAGSELE